MTAHSAALGIASLGRYGDDLIVHMNQEEVQGLQALAKQHGTSLTINPKTGMPEAFKLGKVFKAILPIAAGFALGPGGFGLFDSALMTGLAVGAGTGLLTGNLGQGIMAGFGAYGGFGLGDTLKSLAPAGGSTAVGTANTIQAATGSPLVGASSQFISPFTPNGIAGGAGLGLGTVNNAGIAATSGLGDAATGLTANSAGITNQYSTLGVPSPSVSGFDKSYQGLKSLFEPNGFKRATEVLGTPAKDAAVTGTSVDAAGKVTTNYGVPTAAKPISSGALAMKLGAAPAGAAFAGFEESDLNPQVNLAAQEKQVYEVTGVDAMGRPTYGYTTASAYNPYRNQNLSGVGPLKFAAKGGYIDGYATGGSIQSGGIRDLYGTPDNTPTISTGLGGFGLGRLNNLAGEQAMTQAQTLGYDEGGAVGGGDASGDASGDAVTAETTSAPTDYSSMSYDALVASGIHPMNAAALKGMSMPGMSSPAPSTYTGPGSSMSRISSLAPSISYMPSTSYGTGTPEYIGGMPSASYIESMGYRGGMPSASYIESMGYRGGMPFAGFGELRKREDMAKGGYLDGQGDGMSDSIPATIEGKQPARLADGEFVVPADVVSHLGNGSSKAGSKRLYAMMQKVRKARTGNPRQGKQINPARYMPA